MSDIPGEKSLATAGNRSNLIWAVMAYAHVNEGDCRQDYIREAIEIETGFSKNAVEIGVRMAKGEKLIKSCAGAALKGIKLTSEGEAQFRASEIALPLDDKVSDI